VNYLLDTCLLSELRKPKPDIGVVEWISDIEESRLYISVLSLGEIQKGVAKLENGRRKHALQHWLDHDLLLRFEGRILSLDLDMALEWGLLSASNERKGTPTPVVDALLAVTAITHNFTLVTRNHKDFAALPVKILNPWE
jgi:predicted nucleic acid-binding protein